MDSARAVRWVKVGVWITWGALTLLILSSAVGESPIEPSPSTHMIQLSLVPEGWAFFTRNPREGVSVVYRVTDGALTRLSYSNTSRRNLFGLSRSARAFDIELAALLAPVLTSSWVECQGDPTVCVNQLHVRPLELTNWSRTRYIRGDVVVVRSPPVPWAWSRSRDRIHMPSTLLRLRVDCGQPPPATYR